MPQLGDTERTLVDEVFDINFLNDGEYTRRFEQQLAERLGCKHAVAVTSGTAALFLAMKGLGIGDGDEVIVPDVTFIASANAVTMTGATPVLVDMDETTFQIDPALARNAITPRTKAIMPVHVSGRSADMPAILQLANAHNLSVVEDAAEALMSSRHGKYLGTHGNAGIFSFSPNKTITTGQGGAVVTDDDELHTAVLQLKDQGRPVRGTGGDDQHPVVGFNFKLTNMQAAVGLGQLGYLDRRIERMRLIYEQYKSELDSCSAIRFPGFNVSDGEVPQWTDIVVDRRDELVADLSAAGIDTRNYWHALHTQPPYKKPDDEFPVASRTIPRAMWLPSAFTLTESDVSRVSEQVRRFYDG